MDNLRWIIIFLLIPYHAAMAWNAWGEPNYIYFGSNNVISSIIVFFSPYFMPLLFLLAGMSTKFALQRRTFSQYVLERFKKLLLPFWVGTILFMPFITYLADQFNYGYTGNFFQHFCIFFTKFTDLTGADGGFSVGQFWFVLYLFLISLVAAGIIALQKNSQKNLQKKRMPEWKKEISIGLVCLFGLPLPFLSGLLSAGGKSIVEYTYIFLVGYYVFSNDDIIRKIEKSRWIFLGIGFTATVLNGYMFLWADAQYPLWNAAAKYVSEWFMVLALIGLGKRYLDFTGKVSGYLSKRSYAFYIFHFIWVVFFQYLMFGVCGDNIFLLYLVPVCLAYGATLLCCEICVRLPFLRFLT